MLDQQQVKTGNAIPFMTSMSSRLMCVVCSSEPRSTISRDGLCWVCRRLRNGAVIEEQDKLPKEE